MKYNIIKVAAPTNNSQHKQFMDSNLFNTKDDVFEYFRDEYECYKGDRNLFIAQMVDFDAERKLTDPFVRIVNDDVVVCYYLKAEEVDYAKQKWNRFVNEDNKVLHDSLSNTYEGVLGVDTSRFSHIAVFDNKAYTSIDVLLQYKHTSECSEITRIRLFLREPASYKQRVMTRKIDKLLEFLVQCKREYETDQKFISLSVSPIHIIAQKRDRHAKTFRFDDIKFKIYLETDNKTEF